MGIGMGVASKVPIFLNPKKLSYIEQEKATYLDILHSFV
jgi:hypothetical protein